MVLFNMKATKKMTTYNLSKTEKQPWNKGKLTGQKRPLKLKEIWAIRIRLQLANNYRDLALFNLAIDSKLRACDLVKIRVNDVSHGNDIVARAIVMQQKTHQFVQFEVMEMTREAISKWIETKNLQLSDFLFPSRNRRSPHLSIRLYARIVNSWVSSIGLDPASYGTHTKLESTVRYLGIEVDDALEMAEQTEV